MKFSIKYPLMRLFQQRISSALKTCSRGMATANYASHPSDDTMLAWQINAYGDNSKLELLRTKIPSISKENQILVQVKAASINPIDIRMRGGYGRAIFTQARKWTSGNTPEFPFTLGKDFSGVVVGTGKQVSHVESGDEVWGISHLKQGTHAQYVLVEPKELCAKPHNLSHIEAASIPYVAMTAWGALCPGAGLSQKNAQGKQVLIHAGAGGVGSFAIQLLRSWGAEVTTTCSEDAMELVMGLGAKHAVDYKTGTVKRQLRQIGKFDIILDTVGGETEDYSLGLLKDSSGARYVSLRSPLMTETDASGLLLGGVSAAMQMFQKTVKLKNRFQWAFASPNQDALQEVKMLVEKGEIKPLIDKAFPFSELPKAMARVEAGRARGKTVVDMSEVDE